AGALGATGGTGISGIGGGTRWLREEPDASDLRAERLTRSPDASAAPRASAASETITAVDRRQLFLGIASPGRGWVAAASASSDRASSPPSPKRRAGSFRSERVTTPSSVGGTVIGSGAGSELIAAW